MVANPKEVSGNPPWYAPGNCIIRLREVN